MCPEIFSGESQCFCFSRKRPLLGSDHYVFAFWVVAYNPWKPEGGQSGQEKRR